MSDIQAACRTYLLASAPDVATLVGSQLYPDVLPVSETAIDNADYPAVVMQVISSDSQQHLRGASGYAEDRLQINCYALSRGIANQLGEAVRVALQGYRGFWGAVFVYGVTLESKFDDAFQPIDGSDQYVYTRVLDFEVFHSEAATTTS